MRIGIDNVSTGLSTNRETIGGMRHFLQDTVTWLEKVSPQHEYVLFQPTWADPLDFENGTRVGVVECRGVPRQRLGRILYEQTVYPTLIHQAGVDVFLGTNNVLPLRLKVPSVVVMQSLQYFDFPKIYTWPNLVYLRAIVPVTLRMATRIIALSEMSKQTIVEKTHIPHEKIHVIYHGLSSSMASNCEGENYEQGRRLVHDLTQGKPYLLSVSAFYWQKNLLRLVEAFARMKQRYAIPHVLMLVGSDTAKVTHKTLQGLAAELAVADSVICTGFLPDDVIPDLYRNAAVMVMPSLSETFGIPILEAMSLECPVVTSNVGTMAEIGQPCAVLVDPYDVDSISEGIMRILEDSELRIRMIKCGRVRARAFTLEVQARGYVQVLEEATNA